MEPFDKEINEMLENVRVKMSTKPNGWLAIVLMQGLEKTSSKLASILNTLSIVCGLMLIVSI